MFAPGGIALAMSVIVGLFMKESPEKLGYPPVGDGKPKPKAAQAPSAPSHSHPCPRMQCVLRCLRRLQAVLGHDCKSKH